MVAHGNIHKVVVTGAGKGKKEVHFLNYCILFCHEQAPLKISIPMVARKPRKGGVRTPQFEYGFAILHDIISLMIRVGESTCNSKYNRERRRCARVIVKVIDKMYVTDEKVKDNGTEKEFRETQARQSYRQDD